MWHSSWTIVEENKSRDNFIVSSVAWPNIPRLPVCRAGEHV